MGLIVNKIEILDQIFDPDLDLYAIFGQSTGNSKKPFKVGWMSRDQAHLIDITHFTNEKSASALFNDVACGDITPQSNHVYKDHQKHKLYEWENTYVEPFAVPMSEEEMLALASKIARNEGLELPRITFIEEGQCSRYFLTDRSIEFSHRDDITVMHEMAHALHHAKSNDFVYHGPQYTWILIDLYSRYANFTQQYLTITAHQAGLLGDLSAQHILEKFRHYTNDYD